MGWSTRLSEEGFRAFYSGWSDYFPGYLYVLWFLGKLKAFLSIPLLLLYKLPAILADLATGFLIYKIAKEYVQERASLFAVAAYVFNPAVIANSTFWGQVDSLTALLSLLAVYLLGKRKLWSAAFLSLGILVKPQAAFLVPIVLLWMWVKRWNIKEIASYIALSGAIFLLAFIPFYSGGNFFAFVVNRITTSLGQYPFTSVNAFNLWGLFGFWEKDTITTSVVGFLLVAFFTTLVFFRKGLLKQGRYTLLTTIFFSGFLFLTRLHERHLLPVFAPLALISASIPHLWFIYAGLSLTYLANLYYSYHWVTFDFAETLSGEAIFVIVLINLLLFATFLISISKKSRGVLKRAKAFSNKFSFSKASLSKKHAEGLLLLVLGFSLVSRLMVLGSPPNEYFDEVYHAFTAKRVLEGDPKAWEWWNDPPEGFAYEWTHPPFAKLAMAGGMYIFGENSFGWRLPGALFGVLAVYMVYLLGKEILNDELAGIFAAAIFALDGLSLVMSRIGMNDIYFMTFSLASLYSFLKNKNFLSALFFGFAISSKWSAVWLLPIIFVSHLVFRKKIQLSYLWFLMLPPVIYVLNYLPMFLTGHTLDIFIGVQKQMWWYHTGLVAEHAYTSPWWSWPFLARPIYLFTSEEVGGMVSRIYAMGNPLVFWFGGAAVFVAAANSFIKKNKKLGFLVFAFFAFFATWAVSPRIMFLYHFLPALPFLSIMLAYVLRRNTRFASIFFVSTVLLFIYFYPHWIGLKVPLWLDKSYYWLNTWR